MTTSRRRGRVPIHFPSCLVLTATALALGAAPPEVVRLRVPADRVGKWFPPGTGLKGMSADAFEALVRSAKSGASGGDSAPPRLLRASHSARWEEGVLVGRSELVIAPPRSAPGALALEPWTPAIDPDAKGTAPVHSDDTGRARVRVGPVAKEGEPSVTAVVAWQLRARPGSRGRKFAVGLPGDGPSELTLDLPAGLEPEGPPGLRRGPTPVGDRVRWVFAGRSGTYDLLLTDAGGKTEPAGAPGLWVEGPTRVEVGESGATWALDWSVWGGPRAPRQLLVSLDPGLDLVSVGGTAVDDSQAEPAPDGSTRLTVRLKGPPRGGTVPAAPRVSVRAVARVPSEGRWVVPAARPVGAVWTGGATAVRVDPSRVVESVVALAGRRAVSPAGESTDDQRLDFVADRPAPVAEIVFRKPRADVSADVRGLLLVGTTSPRVLCRITWSIHRGRPQDLKVDLPRAWFADRVEVEGLDEPVSWHTEDFPDGGSRVHVTSPSGDWSDRSLVLSVSATSTVAGGRGPLTLPRVRPVGARPADEVWVARVEPGMTLRPTRARGLAWIDPAAADPARPPADSPRPALAWRWTADDAEGRVERERTDSAPRGTIGLTATLARDRLTVEARVTVVSRDEPPRSLTLGLTEPVADPGAWRFFDESTGQELTHALLTDKARAAAGDLGRGPAWRVDLPHAQRGRVSLTVRHEGRWSGHGRIPLVVLPAALRARGTVLVAAGRDVRTSATAEAARTLDPEVVAESLAADEGSPAEPASTPHHRHAHAFAYDTPGARVEVRTDALTPSGKGGVIREAVLTTRVDSPGGPVRCRLALRVVPNHAASLEVTPPAGASPERVLRDGASVTPTLVGEALSIPLREASLARPQVDVTVEYLLGRPASADPTLLRPERPGFSMPCLSLAWAVDLPEPWEVSGWGPALYPDDPAAPRSGLPDRPNGGRRRGAWEGLWSWRRAKPRDPQADEVLRDFAARLAANRTGETSLGEWLTRLDAGRWPIVVDRPALASAGLGPRSRVVPPRAVAGRPVPPREQLRPLGLTIEPVGRALLLTTTGESPEVGVRRADWSTTMDEAVAWGSDASERFQGVTRWREEPMPRVSTSEPSAVGASPEGRAVWRFQASGWPAHGAEVRLTDRRHRASVAWVVALAILTPGLALRRLPRPFRAACCSTLVALGLIATAVAPGRLAGAAAGLTAGAVALTFLTLGESLPRFGRPRPFGLRSTVTHRRGGGTTPAVLGLAAIAAVGSWSLAQTRPPGDAAGPILALFPFDGPPDISRPPERVLLRLAEYDRLRVAAAAADLQTPATLEAAEARHRVLWTGDRHDRLVVETALTVFASGKGPARWAFPVDEAREIVATLDGAEVPVRIEPGARSASVPIDAGGRDRPYSLVLRRTITPRRGEWGESIGLAVNPVATARIEVAAHPAGLRAEVPRSRGRVVNRSAGEGPAGLLGPVPRFEVRWWPPGGRESLPSAGTVEALYLWDALPAGDRVRARLTYHDPGGTAVVRLALGPGTLVRDWTIPGAADVSLEGTADRREWVARVDPPLPDGTTVALDVFRPRGDAPRGAESTRTPPRVEPLGVERSTGVLAFRRPPDCLGRVAPAAGDEPAGEEAFVRAWGGSLPGEPLTLSGAVKLSASVAGGPWTAVATGPAPATLRVRPDVRLKVDSGRIELALDAELTETAGAVHEAEVVCPGLFRVVRVEADGLTDWSVAPGTSTALRLRFDGPPLHRRRVQVEGWLAVDGDPLASTQGARVREAAVPWPRWPGQDEQPGTLSVAGPTRVSVVRSAGAAPVTPEPGPAGRLSYRVTKPDDPGRLRWEVDPPKVSVRVQSQLTIDPDSAEWSAVLRYEISDGPLDAINLKLPTEWARSASVWLDGVPHSPLTETRRDPETLRESTYWSIRPDRPVWGSQRLVLRSSIPFAAGEARSFPDLSPLGWGGAVDTALRIANASRRPISVEGSPGLQAVASQASAVDDELTASTPRGSSVSSYHVLKSGWSLRVRKPAGPTPGEGPRADHGEVVCTLAADGSVLGAGRYEVGPRSGPFLGIGFPAGTTPLWASVNGSTTRLLNAGAGAWQVPLAENAVSRLNLVWRSEPPAPGTGAAPQPIPLPVVGPGRVPVVVTVNAPGGVEVTSPPGRLSPSSVERVALAKAEWLERETAGSLPGLDRGSRRDGENLVAALARFDLLLRQAERAALFDPDAPPEHRDERVARAARDAGRLRASLSEALRSEGFDEFETAARINLGISPESPGSSAVPSSATPPPVQVRPLGRPHDFQGVVDGTSRDPWLVWTEGTGADPTPADRLWLAGLFAFAALAPPVCWGLARLSGLSRVLGRLALAIGLILTAYWSGPAWLVASAGLAALGRLTRASE